MLLLLDNEDEEGDGEEEVDPMEESRNLAGLNRFVCDIAVGR